MRFLATQVRWKPGTGLIKDLLYLNVQQELLFGTKMINSFILKAHKDLLPNLF